MINFVYKTIMAICLILIYFTTRIQINVGFNHAYGPSMVNDHRTFFVLIFIYCLVKVYNLEKKS